MSECVYEIYPFNTDIVIRGYFTESIDDNVIQYISPAPPDYRSSFSGSALPYANEEQAFENTPNFGSVILKNNKFSFDISTPNGYYGDFTNKIVVPYVIINYKIAAVEKTLRINLDELTIPYRTLSHPEHRKNALFYSNQELPIRNQETLLRDSKYPTTTNIKNNDSFWGLKPAC